MKHKYLYYLVIFFVTGVFVPGTGIAHADIRQSTGDSTKTSKTKITDTRSNKPAYLKNGVKVNFVPFKPTVDKIFGNTSSLPVAIKVDTSDDKVITNVKVYPNPVSDQLNLSYKVNKDSNISIKIMDVLGNEILTLLSEHIAAGEQTNSFNIASKLSSGFYFVRVVAGNEAVIKRISVL
ncbi:T9SS type A sorting domain-containing protein [Daejeonella oryzae]|uniref:T9SS type A sorting domain-containing protein n=1 Tax=Daejeonella oryzae TaxID=1122943 RepID=UPI00040E00EB|nr:T9SS type A sorting domain-containing protein [Daejeonella oryzae]